MTARIPSCQPPAPMQQSLCAAPGTRALTELGLAVRHGGRHVRSHAPQPCRPPAVWDALAHLPRGGFSSLSSPSLMSSGKISLRPQPASHISVYLPHRILYLSLGAC